MMVSALLASSLKHDIVFEKFLENTYFEEYLQTAASKKFFLKKKLHSTYYINKNKE